MKENYIHLIYGEGKGKTSAAVGMAIRAAGAGYKVCFCQFMKGTDSAEIGILSEIPGIEVHRPKNAYPFFRKMSDEQKKQIALEHERILTEIDEWLERNKAATLLIMDELTHALNHDIVDRGHILKILDEGKTEMVITGRDPDDELVERCDYISHIEKKKHPYDDGLAARKGIEF